MSKSAHCFTRDGVTYDCFSPARKHSLPEGESGRRWHVTANGVEHVAFPYAGNELERENIRGFEDRVVSFLTRVPAGGKS